MEKFFLLCSLEFNDEGIGRTRIFFCNPCASYQKGSIEKNHEFIRYVIPKGISMDNLTQQDIDLMDFSLELVNSVKCGIYFYT